MTDISARSGSWLRNYDRTWLRGDILAGITTGAVIIPQGMGYATIAGLPVEIGLYTCIFPLLVYAFVGGSRRLSFSTTSTICAVVGTALVGAGLAGTDEMIAATATLTLMVGVLLVGFRLLRLGWVVEAISEATMTGLKLGVGLTVIADQLLRIVDVDSAGNGFLAHISTFVTNLGDLDGVTVVLATVTLVGLFVLKRAAPRFPGSLLAIVVGIVLVAWFGLADDGVVLIAEVPSGLPIPALPDLGYTAQLLPAALAIAVMAYVESMTAARIARTIEEPPLDDNREFVAGGLAAMVGSLFQTLPPAGGLSQTQVNSSSGARTQLSELVTGLLAVGVALFLGPALSDLPQAVLAAVVIVAVSGLVDVAAFQRLWRVDRLEFLVAVVTAGAALAFDLLIGVVVGVALTIYLVLRSLNHPVVVELRRDPTTGELAPARDYDVPIPGLLALRVEGGIYTLNVRRVQEEILRRAGDKDRDVRVLVIDAGGTADTSVTVMDVLAETDQVLSGLGIILWVAALPEKAEEKARRTEMYDEWANQGKIHRTVAGAVSAYERPG